MTFIRKLLSALFLALCCSAYSNAQQIDNSGNLINNQNWSGAVYGVDPGGCCASISGSGALYDTSTDTIMFSYATDTLTQTIGLQQALGGTGIQVHGYNYSWEFRYMLNNATKNDTLTFNVSLLGPSGNVLESHLYNYDALMNSGLFPYDTWTSASNTVTYQNPYTDPQSISLSITGRDGGFWAGYYGPEVRNVSLSVNYSFDPCAADPLYSSSCPGYAEAYTAYLFEMLGWSITPEPESEIAAIDYSLTPSTSSSMSIPEETTTGEVRVDAGGIEVSTTGELTVPDGIPEEAREKKPVDMDLVSRIVREATDDSAALSVVNRSIEESMAEDANPDFSMTKETLAAIARQTADSVEQSMFESRPDDEQQSQNQTFVVESVPGSDQPAASSMLQQHATVPAIETSIDQNFTVESIVPSGQQTATSMPQMPVVLAPINAQINDMTILTNDTATNGQTGVQGGIVSVSDAAPVAAMQTVFQSEDMPSDADTTESAASAIDVVTASPVIKPDERNTTSNQAVRRDVTDNEAAGDVGIEDIAQEPQDFTVYVNKQLADAQFYQTEVIYRDLEPVDNRRSLRLLSGANDRLHQDMVNDQYRRR